MLADAVVLVVVQLSVGPRDEGQHEGVAGLLEVFDRLGIHREDGSGPGVPGIFGEGVVQLLGAAALVHGSRGAVVPLSLGEPDAACGQSRDAVGGFRDGRGEDVVAEHELLGDFVGRVLLGVIVVHRAAHSDAGVVVFAGGGVDVGRQGVAQADSVAQDEELVGETPDVTLDARVLRGVGFEDRGEDAVLEPAGVELRIGVRLLRAEQVAADVVSPVAVVYVRGGGGELRQVGQRAPRGVGVARECQRIAVRSESAPAVVDEGPQFGILPLGMAEEGVVEPEGVRQPGGELRFGPLLPVEPPEIHAVTLHRAQHGLEIGVGPLPLVDAERHALALFGPPVFPGESVVDILAGLDARGGMEVERDLQLFVFGPSEEIRGRGEELFLPGVAGPADALSVFVPGRVLLAQPPGLVPVHVDDQHVERHVHRLEFLHQIYELVARILPVAAPPVAEGVLRGQRRPACDELEIGQRLFVVVPVGEEIQVLPVACGARFDPLLPHGAVGRQHVARAVVHDGPSRTRKEPLLHRFAPQLLAVASVERAGRAHEVLRVLRAGCPYDLAAVEPEDGFQVFVRKLAAFGVGQRQGRGGDRQPGFRVADLEVRHGRLTVDEGQRGAVLEPAVLAPLHADQLRGEHREACVARLDDGPRVGFGIPGRCAQRQPQGRKKNCRSFHR